MLEPLSLSELRQRRQQAKSSGRYRDEQLFAQRCDRQITLSALQRERDPRLATVSSYRQQPSVWWR